MNVSGQSYITPQINCVKPEETGYDDMHVKYYKYRNVASQIH